MADDLTFDDRREWETHGELNPQPIVESVAHLIGDGHRRQAVDLVRHLRRVETLGGPTTHYAWAELRRAARTAIALGTKIDTEGAAIVFVVAWCERVAADADQEAEGLGAGRSSMKTITVYGIDAPLDVASFCTPDFERLVSWYPEYCRLSEADGRTPADPQPFLTAICHELERLEVREGRDAHAWFARMLEHFGVAWLRTSIQRMKGSR